jgi:hypothetical protein
MALQGFQFRRKNVHVSALMNIGRKRGSDESKCNDASRESATLETGTETLCNDERWREAGLGKIAEARAGRMQVTKFKGEM